MSEGSAFTLPSLCLHFQNETLRLGETWWTQGEGTAFTYNALLHSDLQEKWRREGKKSKPHVEIQELRNFMQELQEFTQNKSIFT